MYYSINDSYSVHRTPEGLTIYPKSNDPRNLQQISGLLNQYKPVLNYCDGQNTVSDIVSKTKLGMNKINKTIDYLMRNNIIKQFDKKSELITTGSNIYYYPSHAAIELTSVCNLSCRHCYRDAKNTGVYLDRELLITFIKNAAKKGLRVVELTGGECLCHPEILNIIESIASVEGIMCIAILSNGWDIDNSFIKKIKHLNDKVIFSVSLDSSTSKFHDEFRQKEGSWRRACNATKILSEEGFLCRNAMSFIPANIFDIGNTLNLSKELGAKCFAFGPVIPDGRGSIYAESFRLFAENHPPQEITDYLNKIIEENKDFINLLHKNVMEGLIKGKQNCGLGHRSWAVSPSGDIRPCVIMPIGLLSIGNIKESIDEIVKCEIINKLHDTPPPNKEMCGDCDAIGFCPSCVYHGIKQCVLKKGCNLFNKSPQFRSLIESVDKNYIFDGSCKHSIF
ncbi:MAG: radical SAM protein [Bacteroidetes bacterium]|nr:radical SAM protein [Bacteroidota bacterium]